MSQEYFWGCELSAAEKEHAWQGNESEEEDDDQDFVKHVLVLKQVVLGASAVEGDLNVVEVATSGKDGKPTKHPIARLAVGKQEQVVMDLFVPNAATLHLTRGKGPVHVVGQHVVEVNGEEEEDFEEAGDEEENGESDVSPDVPVKQKAVGNKAKKAKLDLSKAPSDADDDVEEEEERDDKRNQKQQKRKGNQRR